jgi:hypothetical protein
MRRNNDEVLFEENLAFFLKKRLKKLGLGLVLLILPPIALYCMFFFLIFWSSLFEKETGLILIFLILSPIFGFYFIAKAISIPRIRIYTDKIPNPVLLGKRYVPLNDILFVAKYFKETEPIKLELHLKKNSKSTLDKQIILGEFLENDSTKMTKAFTKLGVDVQLRV